MMVFQKDKQGLLHQVPPDQAAKLKEERGAVHHHAAFEVLHTDEELAAFHARAVAHAAFDKAQAAREAEDKKKRDAAHAKLVKLGLTPEDLQALLGPGTRRE